MDTFKRISVAITVYALFLFCSAINGDPIWFAAYSSLVFLILAPKFVLSPRCVVFAYYFLWFGVAPMFAERYSGLDFTDMITLKAFFFLSTSYIIIMITMTLVESMTEESVIPNPYQHSIYVSNTLLASLSAITVLALLLLISKTGGLEHWINNLDRAFLTRAGAGIYYLLLVLTLPCLLFLLGCKYKNNKIIFVSLAVIILLLTPFIGSKQKIIYMFLVLFLPFFFLSRLKVKVVVNIVLPVVLLFVLGNYFRNASWMEAGDVLAYSLNYFDTLDSLLLVLSNHEALEVVSFVLPLNKVYNLFTGQDQFFDISAYLTNIYFPHAWNIRATVQFPIEVDMFFSFGYWGGLIMLVFLSFVYSTIYSYSMLSGKIIMHFVWFYLLIYLLSHLRGGLILWTDFYVYPYLILVYFFFSKKIKVHNIDGKLV